MWLNSGLSAGSSAQQRCIRSPNSSLCVCVLTAGRRYGHSPRATRSTISTKRKRHSKLRIVSCVDKLRQMYKNLLSQLRQWTDSDMNTQTVVTSQGSLENVLFCSHILFQFQDVTFSSVSYLALLMSAFILCLSSKPT